MSAGSSVKHMIEAMSDDELAKMLRREYLRKLARYRRLDDQLRTKYGMTCEEFEKEDIVAKKDYSWDVEADAQEWEMAIDGIKTCLRKLGEVTVGY